MERHDDEKPPWDQESFDKWSQKWSNVWDCIICTNFAVEITLCKFWPFYETKKGESCWWKWPDTKEYGASSTEAIIQNFICFHYILFEPCSWNCWLFIIHDSFFCPAELQKSRVRNPHPKFIKRYIQYRYWTWSSDTTNSDCSNMHFTGSELLQLSCRSLLPDF